MTENRACKTCQRARLFLTVGGTLILLIYLQPGMAVRIAGRMPDAALIGWAIAAVAAAGFALKLVAWRKTRG